MRRALPAGLAFVMLASLPACFDVERNNPFDPGSGHEFRIEGPGEVTTYKREVQYWVPPFSPTGPVHINWIVSDWDHAWITLNGEFTATRDGEYTIMAKHDQFEVTRVVTVRAYGVALSFRPDYVNLQGLTTPRPLPALVLLDSLGNSIPRNPPNLQLRSEDESVVRLDGSLLVPVGYGSTNVVASSGALADTLRVVVAP